MYSNMIFASRGDASSARRLQASVLGERRAVKPSGSQSSGILPGAGGTEGPVVGLDGGLTKELGALFVIYKLRNH
jgi:hypothetical protein